MIADFYCFEKKTIIEIDGKIHRYRKKKDNLRTQILNSLDIRVLRFHNEDVENELDQVLTEILKKFEMIDSKLLKNYELNCKPYPRTPVSHVYGLYSREGL